MDDRKTPFRGCGAPAVRVIYRGSTKRLFACADCVGHYGGGGKPHNYATDVLGQKPPENTHTGPARTCGEAIGE